MTGASGKVLAVKLIVPGLQHLVYERFEELLLTARLLRLTVLRSVGVEIFQLQLALVKIRALAGIERGVSLLAELHVVGLLQDSVGCNQGSREVVHACNVSDEHVFEVGRIPADLRVEVRSTGRETAHIEDDEESFGQLIDVRRELVGIPAVLVVAAVCVDASEKA